MICVLGCLDTCRGLRICNEMKIRLGKYHKIFEVHQNPPGTEFEYPAIYYALHMALDANCPVLYLHTKGSGNTIPLNYKDAHMSPRVKYPSEAVPEDCQKIVRMMWYNEFCSGRLNYYLNAVNTSEPTMACPMCGVTRTTWHNGWRIDSSGAKELLKTFHKDNNRYYYETMPQYCRLLNLRSILMPDWDDSHVDASVQMWNTIWKFYDNSIKQLV